MSWIAQKYELLFDNWRMPDEFRAVEVDVIRRTQFLFEQSIASNTITNTCASRRFIFSNPTIMLFKGYEIVSKCWDDVSINLLSVTSLRVHANLHQTE